MGVGGLAAIASLGGALTGPIEGLVLLFTCYYLVGYTGCGLLLFLGRSRWLAYPGAVASLAGLLATFWPRTANLLDDQWFGSLTFFTTAFCTYSGIMHAVVKEGRLTIPLRWPATACCAVLCVGLAMSLDGASGWFERTTGVAAAMAAGLALAVIPIRIWEKRRREAMLETTGALVMLNCPRCAEAQEIRAGRRRCRRCRLVIAVDVEEPRCAGCGFALYKLTADRCPECGRAVPPQERWSAAA